MNKKLLFMFVIILGLLILPLVSAPPLNATDGSYTYDGRLYLWYPLIFIGILVFAFLSIVKVIKSMARLDTDLFDVAIAMSSYFAYLFFYYFVTNYFDDAVMIDFLEIFMWPAGFALVILPFIALIFTFFKRRKLE